MKRPKRMSIKTLFILQQIERLDADLKNYRSNSIKESIRWVITCVYNHIVYVHVHVQYDYNTLYVCMYTVEYNPTKQWSVVSLFDTTVCLCLDLKIIYNKLFKLFNSTTFSKECVCVCVCVCDCVCVCVYSWLLLVLLYFLSFLFRRGFDALGDHYMDTGDLGFVVHVHVHVMVYILLE